LNEVGVAQVHIVVNGDVSQHCVGGPLAIDDFPGCFYERGLDCGTIVGLAITNCAH
jgi:hypothetical protein